MTGKIEIEYLESLNIDFIEEVANEQFPECKITRQNWGVNSPFIIIRKGFFVRAIIFIKQKKKKGKTVIGINGSMDPIAIALFGFLLHYLFRGSFLDEVEQAIRNGLTERYNAKFID